MGWNVTSFGEVLPKAAEAPQEVYTFKMMMPFDSYEWIALKPTMSFRITSGIWRCISCACKVLWVVFRSSRYSDDSIFTQPKQGRLRGHVFFLHACWHFVGHKIPFAYSSIPLQSDVAGGGEECGGVGHCGAVGIGWSWLECREAFQQAGFNWKPRGWNWTPYLLWTIPFLVGVYMCL